VPQVYCIGMETGNNNLLAEFHKEPLAVFYPTKKLERNRDDADTDGESRDIQKLALLSQNA